MLPMWVHILSSKQVEDTYDCTNNKCCQCQLESDYGGAWWSIWKLYYLLQKVLLEPMGMSLPWWSKVVSGLRHHLVKKIFDTMHAKNKLPFVLSCEWVWFQHMRLHTWRGFEHMTFWREKSSPDISTNDIGGLFADNTLSTWQCNEW